MKSLQGQLLIAVPKLRDAGFFHSVVLLIRHTDEGAFGLTLNRPGDIQLEVLAIGVGVLDPRFEDHIVRNGRRLLGESWSGGCSQSENTPQDAAREDGHREEPHVTRGKECEPSP